MAISLVGSAEGSKTTSGTYTINLPGGTTTDDLVLVVVGTSALYTTPSINTSGYTNAVSYNSGAGKIEAFYKKMGGTPDSTVVINQSDFVGTYLSCAEVFVFRGVDTTTPIDATATTTSGSSTTPDSPSITTATNGSAVISAVQSNVNDASVTAPSGYGDQGDIGATGSASSTTAVAWKIVTAAGAEDPPSWTNFDSSSWAAVTIALRDATPPVILQPSLYDDGDTFYAPTVANQNQILTQSATFNDPDTFYVGTGAVTLEAAVVSDSDQGAFSQSNGLATFAGLSVGTASANRLVFAFFYGSADAIDNEEPTVTIGGVTATIIASGSSLAGAWATQASGLQWWYANVPSGTTADVTIDAGSGHTWQSLHVVLYSLSGVDTGTPVFQTAFSDSTDPGSVTLDIDTNGFVILGDITLSATAWDAPATEDVDQTASDSIGISGAHYSAVSPETDTVFGSTGNTITYIQGLSLAAGAAGSGLTVAIDTSQNLTPSLFSDGDTFHSATVAATYALTPSLYSDGDTFHS